MRAPASRRRRASTRRRASGRRCCPRRTWLRSGIADEATRIEPNGDERAGRSAREGQQQALGEELADDAHAAGAERKANRDLALTREAARQREVGEVDARDEQHDTHGAEQHEGRAPAGAGSMRSSSSGNGRGASLFASGRWLGGRPLGLARRGHGLRHLPAPSVTPGPPPRDQQIAVRERFDQVGGVGGDHRTPHVGEPEQAVESGRRHADDGEGKSRRE